MLGGALDPPLSLVGASLAARIVAPELEICARRVTKREAKRAGLRASDSRVGSYVSGAARRWRLPIGAVVGLFGRGDELDLW
jgi:hypothetical protein